MFFCVLFREKMNERQKGGEDEEEDVHSYWATLRKREDTENFKKSIRSHSVDN
jgi:hypothetical protein